MADKARITQLSEEASAARRAGNEALAAAKIEEARSILRPHLPKHPNDSWDEVIKRLDVSSPKDGTVFFGLETLRLHKNSLSKWVALRLKRQVAAASLTAGMK